MLESTETVRTHTPKDALSVPEWVCTQPEIKLIAKTALTADGYEELCYHPESYSTLLDDIPNEGHALIEFAGRGCYQSHHNPKGRTTSEYVENIINVKHFSVIEHVSASFLIEGVSRAFSHELIRHRHHSYSQLSQRYVDQEELRFVCPPLILRAPEAFYYWRHTVGSDKVRYHKILQILEGTGKPRKEIREAARSLMPECTETKLVVTGNLRAWREFLEKRYSKAADAEMQAVAHQIYGILLTEYPASFHDISYTQ